MSYVTIDLDGTEKLHPELPCRTNRNGDEIPTFVAWNYYSYDSDGETIFYSVEVPKGTIKKLIGRDLTWDDDPVNLYKL